MMKRKDVLLIVLVLLCAALMLGVSRLMPKADLSTKTADATLAPDAIEYVATPAPTQAPTAQPTAAAEPEVTAVPEATAEPEATDEPKEAAQPEQAAAFGPMPPKQTQAVRGHVVLTVGGRQYGEPIAMDRDKIITLRQEDGKINKVHITPETVYMESSTCDNQDCVGQGEVHVDTYKDRILGTYIICLPNNVSIEMIPAE